MLGTAYPLVRELHLGQCVSPGNRATTREVSMPTHLSGITFPPLEDPVLPVLASGVGTEDVLFTLFAALGAVVIACQFVPGLMLFGYMIRSIFTSSRVAVGESENSS